MKQMKESFDLLKSDICATKNVTKLSECLINMERRCWANAQYSRRECLEITSINSTVNGSGLGDVVCRIVNKAGVAITNNYIEDCHRGGNKRQTIFKLIEATNFEREKR